MLASTWSTALSKGDRPRPVLLLHPPVSFGFSDPESQRHGNSSQSVDQGPPLGVSSPTPWVQEPCETLCPALKGPGGAQPRTQAPAVSKDRITELTLAGSLTCPLPRHLLPWPVGKSELTCDLKTIKVILLICLCQPCFAGAWVGQGWAEGRMQGITAICGPCLGLLPLQPHSTVGSHQSPFAPEMPWGK